MTIDPREYVEKDKRLPATIGAGDIGKVLAVDPTGTGYEHSQILSSSDITGQIIMWPTDTPPSGYLVCDGTQYAFDDYPSLGAILGGLPGGNFNVPDIVFAKNSRGANTLQQEAESVGSHGHASDLAGGHDHTLTINSTGGHTHTTSTAGSHSHGMSNTGSHSHTYRSSLNQPAEPATGSGARVANDNWPTYNTSSSGNHAHSVYNGGDHTHTVNSGGAHGHTGTANSVGDHDHNIQDHVGTTQPACTLINFLIKT